jgi:hypothetical protein
MAQTITPSYHTYLLDPIGAAVDTAAVMHCHALEGGEREGLGAGGDTATEVILRVVELEGLRVQLRR